MAMMRRLGFFIVVSVLLCASASAQNPGSVYPGSLDTPARLGETANNAFSTLAVPLTANATTLTLVNASSFPNSGFVSVGQEIISYSGKSGNTLTGLIRGEDGTTASSHVAGNAVDMRIVSKLFKIHSNAIIALETKLGAGTDINATQLQGRLIASTSPNDGEVIVWSASNNRYQPGTAAGSGGTWGSIIGNLPDQVDLQAAFDAKQNALGFMPVPNTRQVNGRALSSDVIITKGDIGLGNVPNLDATAPANIVQDSTHRFATDAEKSTWNGKQDALGYTAENVANKRTTFQVTPDDTHYPSEKLVKDSLDGKQAAGTYVNTFNSRSGEVTPATNDYTFSQIGSKPTTLSGYGITDAEPTIAAGTTSQYWRGDKSFQTLDKSAVGLGNVDNTSDANKPVSTAQQSALDGKQALNTNLTSIAALANAAGWLHNDGAGVFAYSTPSKSDVGLGSVENTALSTWAGSSNLTTGSGGTFGSNAFNSTAYLPLSGGTLSGGLSGTSLTLSSLTAGRIPFVGTAGLLGDSANLTVTPGMVPAFNVQATFNAEMPITSDFTPGNFDFMSGASFHLTSSHVLSDGIFQGFSGAVILTGSGDPYLAKGADFTAQYLGSGNLYSTTGLLGLQASGSIGSGASAALVRGALFLVDITGAGTTATAVGSHSQVGVHGGGTATTVIGSRISMDTGRAGTANSYAQYIEYINDNTQKPTHSYGLYIASLGLGATDTFSIYDATTNPSVLGGNLTVSGLLKAGSGPTTLTNAAGNILGAALADGSITNAKLANSAITIQGSSVSLGGSALATNSTPQFLRVGLNQAADASSPLAVTGAANNIDLFTLKRNTDTSPTGNFFNFKNAAGSSVASMDVAGNLTVAGCTGCGGGGTTFANPTASVGLTAVNGSATTAMRSDAAPALDQSIAPTWTGAHAFSNTISLTSTTAANNKITQGAAINIGTTSTDGTFFKTRPRQHREPSSIHHDCTLSGRAGRQIQRLARRQLIGP